MSSIFSLLTGYNMQICVYLALKDAFWGPVPGCTDDRNSRAAGTALCAAGRHGWRHAGTQSVQAGRSHHRITRYASVDLMALDRKSTPEHTHCRWLHLSLLIWKRPIHPPIVVLSATNTHLWISLSLFISHREVSPFSSTVYCKKIYF